MQQNRNHNYNQNNNQGGQRAQGQMIHQMLENSLIQPNKKDKIKYKR